MIDAGSLNRAFIDTVSSPTGDFTKLAQEFDLFVRQRVREESFSDKILEPSPITVAECDKSVSHPNPVKIISLEPDSFAMALNFRGDPDGTYLQNKRYEVQFFPYESQVVNKKELELLTETAPITQIVEENLVKDIYESVDGSFMTAVEKCVAATGRSLTTTGAMSKAKLEKGFEILQSPQTFNLFGNSFFPEKMLMHQSTFTRWQALDQNLGLNVTNEVTIDGYKYPTIMGIIVVRTIRKTVAPGSIYYFAPQKYMGHSFVLQEPRFMMHKVFESISMKAQSVRGRGFGNIFGIAKLRFTDWASTI